MKTLELLQEHPAATEKIRKHYLTILHDSIASNPDLPENYKEFLEGRGLTDNEIAIMIDGNPRVLVDVFDNNEVYACLDMQFVDGAPMFGININGAISEEKFQYRIDAERVMITECIKFLETKTN